jgi:antitoxin ParD1/3/4
MAFSKDGRLDQEQQSRLAALDASLALGIADADAGRVEALEAVFDRLDAKYERLTSES